MLQVAGDTTYFRDGKEQVGVSGMELDLVNRVAMAHKVSDAGHGGRAQQPQLGVNIMQ